MPVVLVNPNAFAGNSEQLQQYIPSYEAALESVGKTSGIRKDAKRLGRLEELATVSRPIMGTSVKPDTHAFVQVLDREGRAVAVFNQLGALAGDPTAPGELKTALESTPGQGSVGNAPAWTDWILTSVREDRTEKTQIIETFGADYLYVFGEKPRALSFEGKLFNTQDYNWRASFWANWDRYFRASQLVRNGYRMYIGWDDILVEGYPINASVNQHAMEPRVMAFGFTFFVTNYVNLTEVNKFVTARDGSASIDLIAGGVLSPPWQEVDGSLLLGERKSIIDYVTGGYGDTLAVAADEMLRAQLGADGRISYADEQLLQLANYTVGAIQDLILRGGLAMAAGRGGSFLNSFARSFGYQVAQRTTALVLTEIERATNLKHGEINAWFGWVGYVLSNLADNRSSAVAQALSQGTVADMLKLGSVGRIVQAMFSPDPVKPENRAEYRASHAAVVLRERSEGREQDGLPFAFESASAREARAKKVPFDQVVFEGI